MRVERLAAAECELGEGPVWLADQSALLFTDIIGRALLRWSAADGLQRVDIGARVGCFAPISGSNALIAAVETSLERLDVDFATGRATRTTILADAAPSAALLNDGKCDPAGRFVFGSKALNESDPVGALMRWDGARLETLVRDIVILNGPAFSPMGDRIYFADSPTKKIYAASYDPIFGAMGAPALFAELGPDDGFPDGMATDAAGCLWNAHWDGARLTRYRPDGAVDRVIETPAARSTSVAFGGPDLKTLFVTSAKRGRDDSEPLQDAGAGDLYALRLDSDDIGNTLLGSAPTPFRGADHS